MDYSKENLSWKEGIIGIAMGYAALFFLFYLFYHHLFLALSSGSLLIFFKKPYQHHLYQRKRHLLFLQFKDFLYGISGSIAAGAPMMEAVVSTKGQLLHLYKANSPMIQEIERMEKSFYTNHEKEEDVFLQFAQRSDIEDIRNFVDVYLACRKVGGNLNQIIQNATNIMMDKIDIEKDIKTLMAQKQFEGKIITMMPIGVTLALNLFYPDYLRPLYTLPAGRLVMTLALIGIGISFFLTLKITEIQV